MTGPPGQPWWARPGGAPLRGRPPSAPPPYARPGTPAPAQVPRPPPPTKRSRRKTLLWGGAAIIALEVVVLVAALWFFGVFERSYVLDVNQAEIGVRQILSDPINGYGANDVSFVRCNGGVDPEVKRGNSFVCQVTVNGAPRQVQVVFRDDAGTYEVDGPR